MSNQIYPQTSEHLRMMQTPENWPCWPILPVKKSFHELGILIAASSIRCTVFRVTMHSVDSLHTLIHDPDVPRTEYPSLEAVVADGWKVD